MPLKELLQLEELLLKFLTNQAGRSSGESIPAVLKAVRNRISWRERLDNATV